MITISVSGLDELIKRYGSVNAMETLEPPLTRGLLRIEAHIATYPPAPAHSSYVRTGTLGRRWTHRTTRSLNSLEGVVGNSTEYAPFVQSQAFQRPIFKRIGWSTDEQVLQDALPEIVEDIEQAIQDKLRGRGR